MNNLISIIVPIYKVNKSFLKNAIESVLNQKYKDYELLLIDDGSPDDCGKVCDLYSTVDGRIRVIHKENEVVSIARNTGIKRSKGDWIFFLDADDCLEEDALAKVNEIINNHPADIIVCGYKVINEKKGKIYRYEYKEDIISNIEEKIEYQKAIICRRNSCRWYSHKKNKWRSAPWAKVYKKDLFINNDIWFDMHLHVYEDTLLNARLIEKSDKIYFCNDIIYSYRINDDGAMRKCTCNAIENNLYYLHAIDRYLANNEYIDSVKEIKNIVAISLINDALYRYYCHSKNHDTFATRKGKLEELREDDIIIIALRSRKNLDISLSQKVTSVLMYYRLYHALFMIGRMWSWLVSIK